MQFVSSDSISFSSESLPEDVVERLFIKLQKREPPADIVKQVLTRVRRLPAEQRYPRSPGQPGTDVRPAPEERQEASD